MCSGPSGGSSGGSGSGSGNSSLDSYTSGNVSSMSKGEKLDALDQAGDKTYSEMSKLASDTMSGKIEAGSKEAVNKVNRLNKIDRQIEIARDSVRGYSLSALTSKYSSERKEGYKTSKQEIKKIHNKWK